MNARRRCYREPVAWLVIGLPVIAVAATVWLIAVAGGDGTTDSSPDDVRRMAQVQQRDLAADHAALQRGLSATVRRDGDVLRVRLSTGGDVSPGLDGATLAFIHPLEAARDLAVVLRVDVKDADAGVDAARADLVFDRRISWRLQLLPASAEWRLVGRWQPASATAALRPALGAEAGVDAGAGAGVAHNPGRRP